MSSETLLVDILKALNCDIQNYLGNDISVKSPLDGATLLNLKKDSPSEISQKIDSTLEAFQQWRLIPAPK